MQKPDIQTGTAPKIRGAGKKYTVQIQLQEPLPPSALSLVIYFFNATVS